MNNMFSKAAIWVVIALVLFTVFKQFDERGIAGGATPIAYSDFLDEVKAQRIREATIEDRTIIAITNDGKKIKATTTNLDRGLIGDLVNNGVKFDVKQPEPPSFLSQVFISWFPMLLLIGVWISSCARCRVVAKVALSRSASQKHACWMRAKTQ